MTIPYSDHVHPGEQHAPAVGVVGGGLSGFITASRLAALHSDLEIVMVERHEHDFGGGIAYGGTAGPEHLLNLQAGRISALRELPDDFIDWANAPGTDRSDWTQSDRSTTFGPTTPVRRRLYRQYLVDLVDRAVADRPGVSVSTVIGAVTRVVPHADHVEIEIEGRQPLCVAAAVLATGHLDATPPAEFAGHLPGVIGDIYTPEGRRRLIDAAGDGSVLVIGTALSSYDVLRTLEVERHVGPICMVSRGGLTHGVYPPDHHHRIPRLVGRPRFLDPEVPDSEFIWVFLREFATIRDELRRAGESKDVANERTWKMFEGAIAELSQARPPSFVRGLLQRYASAIVVSRIGVVPEISDTIDQFEAAGILSRIAGSVVAADRHQDGVEVTIRTDDGDLVDVFDTVVLTTGRPTDYAALEGGLWADLIGAGRALPEPISQRGVSTDPAGRLIGPNSSDRIFAVGPMRQGMEITTHGRVGGFVFSIGTLRNQAFNAALGVAQLLRRDQTRRAA